MPGSALGRRTEWVTTVAALLLVLPVIVLAALFGMAKLETVLLPPEPVSGADPRSSL